MKIEDIFVTYEIAMGLNELKFDDDCLAIYYKDDDAKKLVFSVSEEFSSNPEVAKHQSRNTIRQINFDKNWAIRVPTYEQAFNFFREKYNLFGNIFGKNSNGLLEGFYYSIEEDGFINFYESIEDKKWYDSYKKAQENCLLKLIEVLLPK